MKNDDDKIVAAELCIGMLAKIARKHAGSRGKQAITDAGSDAAWAVMEGGNMDVVETFVDLHRLKLFIDGAMSALKSKVVLELDSRAKGDELTVGNASVKTKGVAKKWKYPSTGPMADMARKAKELSDELKSLQKRSQSGPFIIEETAETVDGATCLNPGELTVEVKYLD